MKSVRLYSSLIIAFALCFSCAYDSKQTDEKKMQPTVAAISLADIEPRLAAFDSAYIMLYDNPFGEDAERYTRYYTAVGKNDSSTITLLRNQVDGAFVKSDTLRDCRSEGKMYLFDAGQIKQTLYFATKPEACKHVYIIHEGAYYYMPMNVAFLGALEKWHAEAKEPD